MDPLASTAPTFRVTGRLRKPVRTGTTVKHTLFRRPLATEALCRACQFFEQPEGATIGACLHPDCGCWKRPQRRNPWTHPIPCPKAGWEPVSEAETQRLVSSGSIPQFDPSNPDTPTSPAPSDLRR